jgi:DNA polymerase-3 subunit delta
VILLVRGTDDLAIRRRLFALRDEADGGTGMLATNFVSLDGREARTEDIVGPAMTPPFLSPARLVVVDGFLDRWEPRAEQRGAVRSVEPFDPLFAALASGIPPTTLLVFTGGGHAGRQQNPMVERLKALPGTKDEVYEAPSRDQLLRFIRDEAAARGIRFRASRATESHFESEEWLRGGTGDPVALLAAITNGNTLAISNELDKLALYTLTRDATIDDVYEVCSGSRALNEFALYDAMADGKLGDALFALGKVMEHGNPGQLIIANAGGRFRQLALVAEALEAGLGDDEVAKRLGPAGRYPGLREAAVRRARRLGTSGAHAAMSAVVAADRSIKEDGVDEELAIEVMVHRLCELSSGRST